METVQSAAPLRIGIVAGELSGDTLGEGFIKAILAVHPDAEFIGIGGPKMKALGCHSLFDMEELSVMGIVEVLGRLPRLLNVKKRLVEEFTKNPPDVFVGIDAPDFNLRLERDLKEAGIKTVHYVSPSVWAWRQGRIHGIAKATNLVLALLPFEKAFYDKFDVPCEFVGHTLADAIPMQPDKLAARERLGLEANKRYLAVLPGSRGGELEKLCEPFIKTCQRLHATDPDMGFVVALVNDKRRAQFEQAWQQYAPELDFTLVDDTATDVMTASDVVMLASGTVALECMLIKRPMVVGYIVNPVTAWMLKLLVKTKYVSLPNILSDKPLVKEFLLEECNPDNLHAEVVRLFSDESKPMVEEFTRLHSLIRKDADTQSAKAVLKLINRETSA